MISPIGTEIQVTRRLEDGWDIYTCDDLPGLYVASKNDKEAYKDLRKAISTLIEIDFGRKVSVTHKVDYNACEESQLRARIRLDLLRL